MLELTARIEYACAALLSLAHHREANVPVKVSTLVGLTGRSAGFMTQVLASLGRAGIVASRRGRHGGYFLARPPRAITLKQVIDAVEPPAVTPAAEGEPPPQAAEPGLPRALADVWGEVRSRVARILDGITLEDLLRADEAHRPAMYHI